MKPSDVQPAGLDKSTNNSEKTAHAPRSKPVTKVRNRSSPRAPGTASKAASASGRNHKATTRSKQDSIITLLRRPEGATLDALVRATGWQPHSVRGFLAGTVRKKLKLSLTSEKVKDARLYRISPAGIAKVRRAR
ncbi:Tfp pilus assembly protein PilW [Bradyrhizobium elkanii]|uniref:DUF3489 domain-containing protein n=1 Tax=Bradyrhizobium elkanii TaxID=29448 RepID=UPI0015C33297|nr:DUF3489 domain-containing protein [Bradyrhizobium elkanii]NWL42583.1 DUF3489 domain-containing protein [Bradyrhizobium elkanii]